MSTGELHIEGRLALYELRMPLVEISHVPNPQTELMDHIHLRGAKRMTSECRTESETYICEANFQFPGSPDSTLDAITIDCTLDQVTVANHVHVLTIVRGAKTEQIIFDHSTRTAEVIFRPRSALAQGMWRAIVTPAALFLVALVLAAKSPRETLQLAAMFLASEWVMRIAAPFITWPLTPRFVEAAMALTVAYLALEIILLPNAGKRWIVVAVLGLFHGLLFAPLPATWLMGGSLIQAILIAILAAIATRWATPPLRRAAAVLLLLSGLAWFATSLLG